MERQATFQGLEELFEREVSAIFGYLLLRCGSRAIAQDLTSQTFVSAAERFSDGRGGEVTGPWLQTVASRRLVDHWRSVSAQDRRLRRLRAITERSAPPPSDPDDDVYEALASMPDRQRAALVLRYLDDFSTAEIADVLGLSYKATESLLARARASFDAAYKGHRDV